MSLRKLNYFFKKTAQVLTSALLLASLSSVIEPNASMASGQHPLLSPFATCHSIPLPTLSSAITEERIESELESQRKDDKGPGHGNHPSTPRAFSFQEWPLLLALAQAFAPLEAVVALALNPSHLEQIGIAFHLSTPPPFAA